MVESVDGGGCPSCLVGTLAQEIHRDRPELRKDCCASFEAEINRFAEDLGAAKASSCPGADFDPREWADLFLALVQGSMLIGKARQSGELVVRHLDRYRKLLESALAPKPG